MTNPLTTRRGRPPRAKDDQEVRKALLLAAGQCLAEKPAKSVTIRELAERAGTNSAMIRYYFENKEGLLIAALEDLLATDMMQNSETLHSLAPRQRSLMFVRMFIQQHRSHPWLARLIADEALASDNSLRERFINGPAAKGTQMMRAYIEMQKSDGYFRDNLDVDMAAVSLISLLGFPFVAQPVIKAAHGIDVTTIDLDCWAEHTVNIFEGGCR